MYMLQRFLYLGVLSFLTTTYAHAQQYVFYGRYNEQVLTKRQLDSVVMRMREQYKAQGMGVYLRVAEKIQRHDTIFYDYHINIESQNMVDAQYKLERFVGQPLPAFSLRDLNGQLVKTTSLLGRPAVLNMWFTTCAGCIQEMPELNRVMGKQINQGITFLALTYEKPDKVRAFLRKRPFTFRHIPDAQQYCDLFTQEYPITIFVDKRGIVRSIQRGLPLVGTGLRTSNGVLAADGKNHLDATELYQALDQIR